MNNLNTFTPAQPGWSVAVVELPEGLDAKPEHRKCHIIGWAPREEGDSWEPVWWDHDRDEAVSYGRHLRLSEGYSVLTQVLAPGEQIDPAEAEATLWALDASRTWSETGRSLRPFGLRGSGLGWATPDGRTVVTPRGGQHRPWWPAEAVITRDGVEQVVPFDQLVPSLRAESGCTR